MKNNLIKNALLTAILLCCFCVELNALKPLERRVYYLDCSYSMLPQGNKSNRDLWTEVRNNLKRAIDGVSDERTELIVICFAINKKGNIELLHPEPLLATPKKLVVVLELARPRIYALLVSDEVRESLKLLILST